VRAGVADEGVGGAGLSGVVFRRAQVVVLNRCFPRLTRALLLLVSPRRSNQEEGEPGPTPMLRMGSLRYSVVAGAAELAPAAPGLRQSSPFSRHALRCSGRAGREKASQCWWPTLRSPAAARRSYFCKRRSGCDRCAFLPLCTAEQRRRDGEFGEDCLSPRAARASSAAARHGEQRREVRSRLHRERTGAAGSPSFWLPFSWRRKKK
jgi:hypothetical protein